MLKSITLGKVIQMPKLKMKKNNSKVFDKEWKMYFPSEKARQEFRDKIELAEKNIKEGKTATWEEMLIKFENDYGIKLQH